jgi:hypothetical protein
VHLCPRESLDAALQEQLGLRFESQRAPIELLITTAGLVPAPPDDATKFLNGQCAFTAPTDVYEPNPDVDE